VSEARGTIHDLGYKRYVGTRRPQATRWRVITRQLIAHAWKKWWRYKLWLGVTLLITGALCTVMVVTSTGDMGQMRRMNGDLFREVDQIVFGSIDIFGNVAFLLTLTVGVTIVANDLKTNAFTFYFSRPVRAVDYLFGKWVGLVAIYSTVLLAPMLVIVGTRLGISENTDELIDNLAFVPKTLVIGGLASMAYASLALGFSAIMRNRWLNLAVWCGYFFVFRSLIVGIAILADAPAVGAFDVPFALDALVYDFYGIRSDDFDLPSAPIAIVGLLFNMLLGIGFTWWRVSRVGHSGIGAS
jgi:ABC-2 type transport system permease protein